MHCLDRARASEEFSENGPCLFGPSVVGAFSLNNHAIRLDLCNRRSVSAMARLPFAKRKMD